jgi:hypothetical protein
MLIYGAEFCLPVAVLCLRLFLMGHQHIGKAGSGNRCTPAKTMALTSQIQI